MTRPAATPTPPRHRQRVGPGELFSWLAETRLPDPARRAQAVRALCPCHVQSDVESVWNRILELAADPEPRVRSQAFHALTDGSPRHREAEVIEAIEVLHADPDPRLRRRARKFLAQYRRTGRVNVN